MLAGRHLALAFGFLTRLPVPMLDVDDSDLREATAFFPLVGLVVGALAAVARWGAQEPLGPLAASVLAVTVAVAATGAFHHDGLADFFDGTWGGSDPVRRVEIMRDSRLGTYGAAALMLAMMLEVSMLAAIRVGPAVAALIAGHTLGRLSILGQIRLHPPVSDQGSGASVAQPVAAAGLTVAIITTLVVLGVTVGAWTWAPLVAAGLATVVVGAIARAKLGGLTGDVLGATAHLAMLASIAAITWIARESGL